MDEILIKACGVTYRKGQYITGVGRSTLELMKALTICPSNCIIILQA